MSGYFYDISQYIHDLHDLHDIYMKFSKLFVFGTCRAQNLAKNQTRFAENLREKCVTQNPSNPIFASLAESDRLKYVL